MTRWINWATNDRPSRTGVAHAAPDGNVRNGAMPLACGRWSPDGFDATIYEDPTGPRCKRCAKALSETDARKRR